MFYVLIIEVNLNEIKMPKRIVHLKMYNRINELSE